MEVNLPRRSVLLTMALLIVEQFHGSSNPAVAKWLRELGQKYRCWGVPRDIYLYFHDTLVDSLTRHHGNDWNARLADQWIEAIDCATKEMLKGYGAKDV